jgi:hypothetical protein
MKYAVATTMAIGCIALTLTAWATEEHPMDRYNVAWDSPSEDYNGSMPIGNGDLAANVWVEPSGDPSSPDGSDAASLIFLVSKSDAWNATFRLHAPYETVVEGRVEGGALVSLEVTPETRRSDVRIAEAEAH